MFSLKLMQIRVCSTNLKLLNKTINLQMEVYLDQNHKLKAQIVLIRQRLKVLEVFSARTNSKLYLLLEGYLARKMNNLQQEGYLDKIKKAQPILLLLITLLSQLLEVYLARKKEETLFSEANRMNRNKIKEAYLANRTKKKLKALFSVVNNKIKSQLSQPKEVSSANKLPETLSAVNSNSNNYPSSSLPKVRILSWLTNNSSRTHSSSLKILLLAVSLSPQLLLSAKQPSKTSLFSASSSSLASLTRRTAANLRLSSAT